MWLSSPKAFNDPFDMSSHLLFEATIAQKRIRFRDILKEQGKSFREIELELPKLIRNVTLNFVDRARRAVHEESGKTGVCSFAGDPRSILMWSHYASNHQGVCLVFETARDPKTFLRAFAVDYANEYPVLNWFTEFQGRLFPSMLRKHKSWSYERESRLIRPEGANQHWAFMPEALRAVILGCSVDVETTEMLKVLVRERAILGLPKLEIYQCHQHEREYKLVIRRGIL